MFVVLTNISSRLRRASFSQLAPIAILAILGSALTPIAAAHASQVNTTIDWEMQNSVSPLLTSLTFDNGNFYAGGSTDGENILKSTNGRDWAVPYQTDGGIAINGIAFCDGHGVAVGAGRVMLQDESHTNSSTFNPLPGVADSDSFNWSSVTCGLVGQQMTWVAVSSAERQADPNTAISAIASIDDGQTWTPVDQTLGAPPFNWTSVTYGNGVFVAVANSGFIGSRSMWSSDGVHWAIASGEENGWNSVAYGNGLFVAVSSGGSPTPLMTSPDGANWTPVSVPVDNSWSAVTYGNGIFLALANGGTNQRMMTSSDGITWTPSFAPVRNWTNVAYGNGVYVAVSTDGGSRQLMVSTLDYETVTCPDGGTYDITSNGVATNGTSCNNDLSFSGSPTGSLTLDPSVTEVGNAAFWGADITGSLSGFANVHNIDDYSFRDDAITSLNLGTTITRIGIATFDRVVLGQLQLPNSLLVISDYAFQFASLQGLSVGTSLESIGAEAFSWATQLTTLSLPSTVTSIGIAAFLQSPLTSVAFYSPQLVVGVHAFEITGPTLPCFYNLGNALFDLTDTGLYSSCSLTTTAGQHGSINLAPRVVGQDAPSYTISPAAGFDVAGFSVDGVDVKADLFSANGAYTYTLPATATSHDLSVSFGRAGAPTDWQLQESTPGDWTSITYGGGKFILGGNSTVNGFDFTTDPISLSDDGETWGLPANTFEFSTGRHAAITYCQSKMILVGLGSEYSSDFNGYGFSDGVLTSGASMSNLDNWQGAVCVNGKVVAVSDGVGPDSIATSFDGGHVWKSRKAPADLNWTSVTYGEGMFVAVAKSGTGNRVMTSPDGYKWTSRTSAADNEWNSVTYGKGTFVAVASTGSNRVMTSPDGITWTARTAAASKHWNSVTYGNGLFVAVSGTTGTNSNVMSSVDGIHWASITSPDQNWKGVTFGANKFVAVSSDGGSQQVMTSIGGASLTATKLVMETASDTTTTDTSVISTTFTNNYLVGQYRKDVECTVPGWTADTTDGFTFVMSGQIYDVQSHQLGYINVENSRDYACSGNATWVTKIFDPSDPAVASLDRNNLPFSTPSVASLTVELVRPEIHTFPCGTGTYQVDALGVASNGASCNSILTLDSSVRSVAAGAFVGAELSSVVIQDGVTAIGDEAFMNIGTETLVIPDSVVTIGDRAFKGDYISSLTLGSANSALKHIGEGAFYDTNIDTLDVPDSVTSIGKWAFFQTPLTSLSLGKSVQTIGVQAFASFDGPSLVIPATVTSLGDSSFKRAHLTRLVNNSSSITLGAGTLDAATPGLHCFYNVGGAPLTGNDLAAAGFPNPCQIVEIDASAGGNGSISTSSDVIEAGSSPTYLIAPESGYEVDTVLVDGTDVTSSLVDGVGSTKNFVFDPVNTDRTIVVTFKRASTPVSGPAPSISNPTPTPTPTPTPSPTPTPTPDPTPGPGPKPVSTISVSGFAPGSSVLTVSIKKALQKLSSKLIHASSITVIGMTEGPKVLPVDFALSKMRAAKVRAYMQSLLGRKVIISIGTKQSLQVGNKLRAVKITVRN